MTADLAPTLLAGSSAFLASVAMNLLFLGSQPSQPRECPRGWEDGSSVGMGCVWAEAKGRGVNQTEAKRLCKEKDPGARLVEIYSQEQQDFLVKYMRRVEAIADLDCENEDYDYYDYCFRSYNLDCENEDYDYYDYYDDYYDYCFRSYNWWIGLEKNKNTDDFQWISGSSLNFTAWSDAQDCVQAFSARYSDLAWYAYYCSDTYDTYPLCQIPAASLLSRQTQTDGQDTSRTSQTRSKHQKVIGGKVKPKPSKNVHGEKVKPKNVKLGGKRRKSSKLKTRNKSRTGRSMKEAVRIPWKFIA